MLITAKIKNILAIAAIIFCTEAGAMDYAFLPGYGLQLAWKTNDMVGITTGNLSFGEMEQLSFWASSRATASPQEKNLFAVGYQLKTNSQYYSYSPYLWSETFDAHSITCRYDNQTQNGNGNASSLSSCDYQMAEAMTSSSACQFNYQHAGGVLRISFLAPAAITINTLTLTALTSDIVSVATMDIMNGTMTAKEHATTLTLQTSDISVAKGEPVILYLASPPQDLSSTVLKVIATDSNSNEYVIARIMGPNVQAGKLYDIALTSTSAKSASAKASAITGASQHITLQGIANPVATTQDILLDPEYSVVYAPLPPKGDVNGDGTVNTIDAITLIGHYLNNETEKVPLEVGDMNDDRVINTMDAIEIINIYNNPR